MITVKNQHARHFLMLLGICLITSLALIGGTIATHAQSFAPFAHAAHTATLYAATCATTGGAQPHLCEHQDPMQQGCVTDAETLDLQTVFRDTQHTTPLGEVEIRYSPICKTYWVRTTAFPTAKGIFKTIHADITFHDQTKEDSAGAPTFPDPRFAYVAWTDMTTAPMLLHGGSGSFDLIGQTQPLLVFLNK